MNRRILFSIFAVLIVFSISVNAQNGVAFKTSSYENMLAEARKTQTPFMIAFGFPECNTCQKMEAFTYSDQDLGKYISKNITPYKVDAFSLDGIGITQLFDVRQFPTLLVFSPNGEKIATLKGYYEAGAFRDELATVLTKWNEANSQVVAKNINDLPEIAMTAPTYTQEEYVEKRSTLQRNAEVAEKAETESMLEKMQMAAGEMEENADMVFEEMNANLFLFSDVPGLQKYSVKDKKPEGYALKVGQFNTLEGLKSELKEYEKRWKSEIWTYSQAKNGAKIYCLVLGQYEDKEQAIYMRKLLYNTFFIQSTVVKLDDIRYEK